MHGQVRSGHSQRLVLKLEPTHAALTIGYALMALILAAIALAALLYPEPFPAEWQPDQFGGSEQHVLRVANAVSAGAALVGALCLLAAVVKGRRWHIQRVVVRFSNRHGGVLPDARLVTDVHVDPPTTSLDVQIRRARRFRRSGHRPRHLRPDSNVEGHPPLRIAYLRVFENQSRLRTFLQGPWREYGYVYFLRSAASVSRAEYVEAKRERRDLSTLLVDNTRDLHRALGENRVGVEPRGRRTFRRYGARTIRTRDRYGSYPVRSALCHGTYWQRAVDHILEGADLVVLDLSGASRRHAGIRYELRAVLDRISIDRVIFLADARSKKRYLRYELRLAWSMLSARSPNRSHPRPVALVAVTDAFRVTQQQTGNTTQTYARLVARRRQTRRVVAEAQRRLDQFASAS